MENGFVPSVEKSGSESRPVRRFSGETTQSAYPLRACSACAGDYEDPDRSAWTDNEDIEPEDSEAEGDSSQTG